MKKIFLTMLFALMCAGAYAQGIASLPDSAQTAQERLRGFVRNVETFGRLYPQEKAYLHLDNTGYFIGDTIWYKAYVVRPDTMAFTNLSGVLYVELVDPFGEILVTQKLKIEDGQCHGDIALSEVLTSGFYEIRAYTRYMTNWPAENIFSRVVPVFAKPKREGDYSHLEIAEAYTKLRTGDTAPDSLSARQLRKWRKEEPTLVSFYPEGGRLVRGLMSTVAFEVSLPDSAEADMEGELRTEQGEVLASVRTLREGRGTFTCTPGDAPLYLCFTHDGQSRRVRLPEAEAEGCVMTVGALAAQHIGVQVACSYGMKGQTLGLSLMQGGRILSFDTHTFEALAPWNISFPRKSLPAGVHQLTLFDSEGRIWAQRHFFVLSDGAERLSAAFADSTIAPCRHMGLALKGPAGGRISLSLRDADAQTNDGSGNAATYLLLSSDLKGFVRDAEYYLEADDNAHRQAADLLCLVQGWARYDWQMMRAGEDFRWTQPIEDGLYLDGMLHPRLNEWGSAWMSRKAKRATRDVAGVRLSVRMYTQDGETAKGETVTDSLGHYVFNMPDLRGDWTAQLHTTKGGKEHSHIISVNRGFQPARRMLGRNECELHPAKDAGFSFRHDDAAYDMLEGKEGDSLWLGDATHELEEAVVKDKARRLQITRRKFIERSQLHFDMQREADKYIDRGQDVPMLEGWLLSQPVLADLYYNKKRGIGYVGWGGRGGDPFGKALFSIDGHPEKTYRTGNSPELYIMNGPVMQGAGRIVVQYGGNRNGFPLNAPGRGEPERIGRFGPDDILIDGLKDVYVSLEDSVTKYMFSYEKSFLKRYNPFHVYIEGIPMKTPMVRKPSARRTYFQGYNVPHTFHMPDYSQMPPEADFRRTLYWNPDVLLDDNGEAIVEFYNNSTCRRISVSAEGVTADGKPIQTSTAYHPRHVAAGAAH